jgi:hypothetical protein
MTPQVPPTSLPGLSFLDDFVLRLLRTLFLNASGIP